jgi:3-methylfumaryl-CoA hydratase
MLKCAEGYPALVVHGPLAQYYRWNWCAHAHRIVTAFAFRAQAPLFDLAPFGLIGTPVVERMYLEAQGPDGMTR